MALKEKIPTQVEQQIKQQVEQQVEQPVKPPTPSEVAEKAQQPKENNVTTFTQEELQKLQDLQTKTNQIVTAFGQLKIQEINLKSQTELLNNQLDILRKEEKDLATSLSEKYGKGTLNADTGEFTPTK